MGESNLMQIYGNFEGFPENNSALFGLVSYNDPCWLKWKYFYELELPLEAWTSSLQEVGKKKCILFT